MRFFKNTYEEMQWFKDMSEAEKKAYLARHHQTDEYLEQEADLYENDFYEWDRNRNPIAKVLFPFPNPPHPLYGKSAAEKVESIIRWIL